ncbi:hypothetical protein FOC4_g10010882 [Fusarium odoratissimum]|uniref:Uncharacterized protein n=1 Tax=Fusarium oxysporum f. sp. cubense (strain race 4) TaxID=2502994 RepID=N1RCV3_FUSC4|nr:hypothetical protein FOC4_g10010882 [Fusarium odoratissimum]
MGYSTITHSFTIIAFIPYAPFEYKHEVFIQHNLRALVAFGILYQDAVAFSAETFAQAEKPSHQQAGRLVEVQKLVTYRRYNAETTTRALLLLATVANAWKFTIYGDGDCESTPSGDLRGDGNKDCTSIPNPHRGFWLEDMGNCQIDLYANEDDCDDGVPQQFYDATNQGVCIGPQFQWDYYTVVGC